MSVEVLKPKLLNGKATRQLAEIIPADTLQYYLNHYRLIKNAVVPYSLALFARELVSIIVSLEKFEQRGWISLKHKTEIVNVLVEGFTSAKPTLLGTVMHRTKQGRKKDAALNFLLHVIVYDIKVTPYRRKRGIDVYQVVIDFLREQGIEDATDLDPASVRKRYKRVTRKDIFAWFDLYQLAFPDEALNCVPTEVPGLRMSPFLKDNFRRWDRIFLDRCIECAGSKAKAAQCMKADCELYVDRRRLQETD